MRDQIPHLRDFQGFYEATWNLGLQPSPKIDRVETRSPPWRYSYILVGRRPLLHRGGSGRLRWYRQSVPYCTRCGTAHADDAAFCPWCGEPVAPAAAAGGTQPEEERRVSAVIGRTLGSLFSRPGAALLGILTACVLVWLAALVALVVIGAWLMFGTLHPHSIVDTSCFVRHDDPATPNGWNYTLVSGCQVFRIHPAVATVTLTVVAAALALAVVGALLYLVAGRAADRRFGARTPWPLLPGAASVLRTVLRVLGWGILAYLGLALATAALILAFIVLGRVGGVFGVLVGVGGCIYLLIWWLVPLGVRLELAFVRMVIDDRGLAASWRDLRVSMGQAWAFVGLTFAVSIGLSIVGNLVSALGKAGLVLALPVQLISYTVQLVLLVAVMRFLAGELATDDAAGAP